MQAARMGHLVLSQADIKDFAIYDNVRYELFLRMHPNKKQFDVNYNANKAALIANCWILNVIGDNS